MPNVRYALAAINSAPPRTDAMGHEKTCRLARHLFDFSPGCSPKRGPLLNTHLPNGKVAVPGSQLLPFGSLSEEIEMRRDHQIGETDAVTAEPVGIAKYTG